MHAIGLAGGVASKQAASRAASRGSPQARCWRSGILPAGQVRQRGRALLGWVRLAALAALENWVAGHLAHAE
jgi:hypothetical protein